MVYNPLDFPRGNALWQWNTLPFWNFETTRPNYD